MRDTSLAPGCRVDVAAVGRRFGPRAVLRGLSLTLAPGEFVAVVGRSGTGKSTLLRLMCGIDRPDEGEVRVDGVRLEGPCPRARVVFQDGRLLPWLRVGDNVALGLPPARRAAADGLLAEVGLAERAGDWPAVLSGGQRQRVALARALAGSPRLLLLDEPLGSLDAMTRLDMQALVERLWQEHRATALLITHDIDEAVTLADRILLLEGGRVAAEWAVPLPRPRRRDDLAAVALAGEVLRRVRG